MAALVLGLALAVTACGSGTPISNASAPHATPPPTQTPTPVPSLATTWRIIPSPNPPSLPNSRLVAGTPLAAGGLVYVGSITGVVTALDAADGRVRWQHREPATRWSFPAVADGTLYATAVQNSPPNVTGQDLRFATSAVYALDAADGSVRWHYDARGLGFEPVTVAQ